MNYIAEIKAFYDRLELNPQPNTVIALWHALMSIANRAGWPDMFTAAQSSLMLKSGLSASAFKRARNKLATDGFIEWKSRGGNLAAQYKITSLAVQYGLQTEPQTEPQSGLQTEPQTEPQSGPINKHKQKQIKEVSKDTKKSFEPPSVEDVRAYCLEHGYSVNADVFVDFYTANGWVQGKGKPVRDWRAAVRYWENNKKSSGQQKNKFNQFKQHDYDFGAIEKAIMEGK